jgi:putative Mg2+ transporter-C (MgtC) family protein
VTGPTIAQVLLAGGLGFCVGVERRLRGNIAGARTFALLTLGSAGFTAAVADPAGRSRVIAGVVTGVGFIGAGTILREAGNEVLGTATAAAAWASASVGVLCGVGSLATAAIVTVATLTILELPELSPVRHLIRRVGIATLDSDPLPERKSGT